MGGGGRVGDIEYIGRCLMHSGMYFNVHHYLNYTLYIFIVGIHKVVLDSEKKTNTHT